MEHATDHRVRVSVSLEHMCRAGVLVHLLSCWLSTSSELGLSGIAELPLASSSGGVSQSGCTAFFQDLATAFKNRADVTFNQSESRSETHA